MKLDPKALAKLDRAINKGFRKTVDAYADNCHEAIEAEIWKWDGTTLRKNGDFVGSPRDIVDTGELRDSQQEPVYEGDKALIEWTADHAIGVHEGISSTGEPMPARPWTDEAKNNTDFEAIMAAELRKQL
jgi:hypothetical protein